MTNGVSVRNLQSTNFRINTYEKVHLVGLFIQMINAVAAIKFERKAEGPGERELLKSVGGKVEKIGKVL